MPHGHRKGQGSGKKANETREPPIHSYFTRKQAATTEQNKNKMADVTKSTTKENETEVHHKELKELIISLDKKLCSKITGIEKKFDEFKRTVAHCVDRVEKVEKKVDDKLKEVDESIEEMKKSAQFCSEKFDEINNVQKQFQSNEDLIKRIEFLENQAKYQEARSRKYNVLIYGLADDRRQTEMQVREFMSQDLKIEPRDIERMIIQNTHRIPRRHEEEAERDDLDRRPDPIIVKFARMKDRDFMLKQTRNIDRGRKVSVRTDLPQDLKKKRNELAKVAYNLRKNQNLKTAIREAKNSVWLETRKTSADRWSKYEC